MQPNPHSATVAGPDHLSYFALLGRVAGLALYHQEPLDVRWSDAFIKAVLEMPITAADLRSVDPELYECKVRETSRDSILCIVVGHACAPALFVFFFLAGSNPSSSSLHASKHADTLRFHTVIGAVFAHRLTRFLPLR